MSFLQRIFGSNERQIAKLRPIVEKINTLEDDMRRLADHEIASKTGEFRERLKKGETIDDLLPEAFALTREAARRVIGERHFDVQLLGGIVLHRGKIAEMKTGEGKTLTATLAVYLNALVGKGVHVVTVNDYLARRDCNWMGAVYHMLGLTTSCIVHSTAYRYVPQIIDADEVSVERENLVPISRADAYAADITYGTNNEFGFDYLRDNMAQRSEQVVQKPPYYAIVDEVDSILIDEARTPLIISAPDTESTKLYQQFAAITPKLSRETDYVVDEKMRAVTLTDNGIAKVEKILGVGNLYEHGKIHYVHHLEQSLRAHALFQRDKDYVVRGDQVAIVDEFTGRLMEGRRYSEGLHQAIEAKEGVTVQRESRTLATITFQNYFRMYEKLGGMTGTAVTSAEEFQKVYELDVLEIPTHKPMIRKDTSDIVYKTERAKFTAIVRQIKELHAKEQPILVGTIAIEKSEQLSELLRAEGIRHEVLNAKNHEREAAIIAAAGQKGGVTIATNMAGRGTDIKLGDGVAARGGLFVIGTERHEARRIDNQLRGRSGRQGDPGATQFYVSLEDELMRRFGGDRLKGMMNRLGLPEDQPIENAVISKTIESAQSKIEGFNFDIRKHVLDYDNVMNKQREVVYKKRRELLSKETVKSDLMEWLGEEMERTVSVHAVAEEYHWNVQGIIDDVQKIFPIADDVRKKLQTIHTDRSKDDREKISAMIACLIDAGKRAYGAKENEVGMENMRQVEKTVMVQTIDQQWISHLEEIDYLRQGIGLRGYGQRDPLIEYKKEAFALFGHLMERTRSATLHVLFHLVPATTHASEQTSPSLSAMRFSGASDTAPQFSAASESSSTKAPQQPLRAEDAVGRNDPCPCGSGKKYKKCHGV